MRRPVPLTAAHRVDTFCSGEPTLDGWLRRSALEAQARGTARTFVALDDGVVVGYYALAGHLLSRDALPPPLARGELAQIPAVLHARLAVDEAYQGKRLGTALLGDALRQVVDATQVVAARYVVVDALHEGSAAFYVRHGFRAIPGTMRLVRKVSDISRDLGE